MAKTPNRGYELPVLGKKPWKTDWDTNFTKVDSDVGGLVSGTTPAGKANTIAGAALSTFVQTISGTLTSNTVPDGTTLDLVVDHSGTKIFDVPCSPIFINVPSNVTVYITGTRTGSTSADLGGKFSIQVANNSGSSINTSVISWYRKGIKIV